MGVVLLKKLFPSKFLLKCSHLALIRNATRLLLSTFCASNTSGKNCGCGLVIAVVSLLTFLDSDRHDAEYRQRPQLAGEQLQDGFHQ